MRYRGVIAYILPLFLMPFSALVTQSHWLDFGINPNFFIATISAFVFFINSYLIFILGSLLGILFLKFRPTFEIASLSLMLLSAVFIGARKILPIFSLPGSMVLSFLGTFLFYAFHNHQFIILHASVVFWESLYNSILSVGLYLVLRLIYEEER